MLRRHQLLQAAARQCLGPMGVDNDLVFFTQTGRPLMPGNVYRQLIRVLKRAGLPHIRFHDLRHTAATLLLSARVNPKVVSEMLGHASTTITLDIYSHVLPDMQQDAAEAMGHLLFSQHVEYVPTPTLPTSTVASVPQVSPTTQHDLLSDLLSNTSSSATAHPQRACKAA